MTINFYSFIKAVIFILCVENRLFFFSESSYFYKQGGKDLKRKGREIKMRIFFFLKRLNEF